MDNKLPITNKKVDTEDSPDYVGIKSINGKVEITIPMFLSLTEVDNPKNANDDTRKEDKDLLLCFLRSINLAKTLNKEYFNKQKLNGDVWPIESYLWIINDYLENGYYFNRDKQYYTDGKGKIIWKKTIKNTPIISDGNIIYDKLVTTRMAYIESKITDIYKICLKQALDKMSWYRNLNIRVDVFPTMSANEMLHIVKKELVNTFDDIKRLRFNHMIKILSSTDNNDLLTNNYTLWINNYHYVYEKMIDYYFHGISDDEKKKFNPKGLWSISGYDKGPFSPSELRPDTIYIKNGNEVFIIDAKMYKFGWTFELNDLPKTDSIQKQITYGDHIMNSDDLRNKYGNVKNAFIIPYNPYEFGKKTFKEYKPEKINDHLYYLGIANAGWRDTDNPKQYENIYTFIIDFNYLLENYMKADESEVELLCQKIDEKIARTNG